MTEKISPMDSKRWTHKKKKAVIPVMLAGILLCASSVGLGFAFTGGFFDSHDGGNIPTTEITVNSEKGITFDATKLNLNLDTESVKGNKSVYFISGDNSDWTVSADKKTATQTVDLVKLVIKGEKGTTGALNVNLTCADSDYVSVKMVDDTPTQFTIGDDGTTELTLSVVVTVTAPALDNTGFPTGTPAFGWTTEPTLAVNDMTLRVVATVE